MTTCYLDAGTFLVRPRMGWDEGRCLEKWPADTLLGAGQRYTQQEAFCQPVGGKGTPGPGSPVSQHRTAPGPDSICQVMSPDLDIASVSSPCHREAKMTMPIVEKG